MNELEHAAKRGPGRPPKYQPVDAPIEAALPRQRPSRKPFGAMEQKLAYPAREGFHRHWANEDRPGGIPRMIEAGYEHVKGDDGKNVVKVVGTQQNGLPQHAYLMEIPEEWFKKDMKAQQARVDETEAQMKKGQLEGKEGDGRYIPAQGIKITHGN